MKYLKLFEKEIDWDDFDNEEFDHSKDKDLVDAIIQIIKEDFESDTYEPYDELLKFVSNDIKESFIKGAPLVYEDIDDAVMNYTEMILNDGRSPYLLKDFVKKIVKNYRKEAIGFLPEELWKNFD